MILPFVKAAFKIHAVAVCLGPQFATSLSSQPVLLDYVWGGIKEGSAYKGSMSDLPVDLSLWGVFCLGKSTGWLFLNRTRSQLRKPSALEATPGGR